jgi:L-rhamnose isomerase
MRDIHPFFGYIAHGDTGGHNQISPELVQSYVAAVKASCLDTGVFYAVLAVNDKICAVKMFCLQMFIAGRLPEDYADNIGFIELPKRQSHYRKEN